MANTDSDQPAPPYIPFKSFKSFIEHLKATVVPDKIDNTVRPGTMAGGLWVQIRSALKYLGLVGPDNSTTDRLKKLVASYGTDGWPTVFGAVITEAYAPIGKPDGLATQTMGQLNDRFKSTCGVEGQMREKAIRFYLAAFEEIGATISPLLKMRGARTAGHRRERLKRPTGEHPEEAQEKPAVHHPANSIPVPKGFTVHPFQLRKDMPILMPLPTDLTQEDVKRLNAWMKTLPIEEPKE